jgi:hypothetical protein
VLDIIDRIETVNNRCFDFGNLHFIDIKASDTSVDFVSSANMFLTDVEDVSRQNDERAGIISR